MKISDVINNSKTGNAIKIIETEINYYCKLKNPNELLDDTSICRIHQHMIPGEGGLTRVRKYTPIRYNDTVAPFYESTIKHFLNNGNQLSVCDTLDMSCAKVYYDMFKRIAKFNHVKLRFQKIYDMLTIKPESDSIEIQLPPIIVSIDVLIFDKTLSPWVKVELEVDSSEKAIDKEIIINLIDKINWLHRLGLEDCFSPDIEMSSNNKIIKDSFFSTDIFLLATDSEIKSINDILEQDL